MTYKSINISISWQITKCVFKNIIVDCNHCHNNKGFVIECTSWRKINNKFISFTTILLNTTIEYIYNRANNLFIHIVDVEIYSAAWLRTSRKES